MWTLFVYTGCKTSPQVLPWEYILIQAQQKQAKKFFTRYFGVELEQSFCHCEKGKLIHKKDYNIITYESLERVTSKYRGWKCKLGEYGNIMYSKDPKYKDIPLSLGEFIKKKSVILFFSHELISNPDKIVDEKGMEQFITHYIKPQYIKFLKSEIDSCLLYGEKDKFYQLTERLNELQKK